MEVPHPDLAKVPRMVFVEVRAVVVLASRHSAAAGVLAVFADAAMARGDVAATVRVVSGRP